MTGFVRDGFGRIPFVMITGVECSWLDCTHSKTALSAETSLQSGSKTCHSTKKFPGINFPKYVISQFQQKNSQELISPNMSSQFQLENSAELLFISLGDVNWTIFEKLQLPVGFVLGCPSLSARCLAGRSSGQGRLGVERFSCALFVSLRLLPARLCACLEHDVAVPGSCIKDAAGLLVELGQ